MIIPLLSMPTVSFILAIEVTILEQQKGRTLCPAFLLAI
jgi:hypothetical protein